MLKRVTILCAVAGALTLGTALAPMSVANADGVLVVQTTDARYYDNDRSNKELRRCLRNKGFHDIKIKDNRGREAEVRATNRRGVRVELIVDRKTCRILDRDRIGKRHDRHYDDRYHDRRDGYHDRRYISEDRVRIIVRDRGYHRVTRIHRRGDAYWVHCHDRRGRAVTVVIGGHRGDFIRVSVGWH